MLVGPRWINDEEEVFRRVFGEFDALEEQVAFELGDHSKRSLFPSAMRGPNGDHCMSTDEQCRLYRQIGERVGEILGLRYCGMNSLWLYFYPSWVNMDEWDNPLKVFTYGSQIEKIRLDLDACYKIIRLSEEVGY